MEEEIEEHDCEENAVYYEFIEDIVTKDVTIKNHRYHGYECGVCGKLLQVG